MRLFALFGLLSLLGAAQAESAPEIAVSDVEFGFLGSAETATNYVSISNLNHPSPLMISAGVVTGDPDGWFSFAAPGCDRVATCPFTPPLSITTTPAVVPVRCAPPPGATGERTAIVTFTSNATSGSGAATLRCTAGATIAVSPASHIVDFGLINLRGTGSATSVVRIRNTGSAPLSATAAAILGPDSARFVMPPFAPVAIPAGGQLDVAITYNPIAERPLTDPDVGRLTVAIDGTIGSGIVSVALRGRGGAPHASLISVPTFADSFTNPGPAAQILPITIANTGESVLVFSNPAVTDGPTWKIMNPDPVEVPGGTTYSWLVRFTPTAPGPAPSARFSVNTNDTNNATLTATLTGNGVRRDVTVVTDAIDLFYAGVATTAKLTDGRSDVLLTVQNLDQTHDFEIREIRVVDLTSHSLDGSAAHPGGAGVIDGEEAFTVLGAANVRLQAGTTRGFDIAFTPPHPGEYEATALVFLDSDPEPQGRVALRGHGVFVQASGGGCATTQSAGIFVVAAIAVLLLTRRGSRSRERPRHFPAHALPLGGAIDRTPQSLGGSAAHPGRAVVFALLCTATTTQADTRNLDIAVFDPTPATSGLGFALQSPEVGRNGTWTARALVSYAYNPLVLMAAPNDNVAIRNRTTFALGGAYAFGGRFEAGARMPLYIQSGENLSSPTMFGEPPASGTARGTLTIHGKARTWRHRNTAGVFSTGLGLSIGLPTASDQQFAGNDSTSLRARVLASFVPAALSGRLVANVDAGAVVRATADFHDVHQRSGAVWGIGTTYRTRLNLAVTAELFGELIPGGRRDAMGGSGVLHTAEGLVGIHYPVRRHVDLGVALSRGLASGPGAPALRGMFAVTVTVAPPSPAVFLGSGNEDSDRDGISDDFDRCPDQPEDLDGFADDNGCPDSDNDGDGLADTVDKCPNAAEDKDSFEDGDGCPDPDDDGDGIRDEFDHCPRAPETINGNADDDGCPDVGEGLVTIEADRIVVASVPDFTSKGDVGPGSFHALGQLAATLRAHPELIRIRIVAPPARAQALVNWLVQWGIAADRLEIGTATSEEVRYEIVKRRQTQ